MEHIAYIRNGFSSKFGIPRQSGIVQSLKSDVIFYQQFRNSFALRGLENFSHIWLIWEFSASARSDGKWSPTVRPPRLGGNERVGVFATRSPFRPNPIGLSCVKLDDIDFETPEGPVLHISGADMMDGTPVFDIKPYIPFTDCRPEASAGFTELTLKHRLEVVVPDGIAHTVPSDVLCDIRGLLAGDPRPGYQHDPERVYAFEYSGYGVRFTVVDKVLQVVSIDRI